jgi:hypothetical protein
MPIFSEEIKTYGVYIFAGGKNKADYRYRAIVGCRRDDGSAIGALYFHRRPDTMPDSDYQGPSGKVSCHFPWSDFAYVLDLLRNERPIYLEFVAGIWNQGRIVTSHMEPVGEGERNELGLPRGMMAEQGE